MATDTEKTAKKCVGTPFQKGDDPRRNLEGRPKGAGISITTEIKRALAEKSKDDKATNLQLLIEKILDKALEEGDQQTIKQIWNYIDGMPAQNFNLGGQEDNPIVMAWKEKLSQSTTVQDDGPQNSTTPTNAGTS